MSVSEKAKARADEMAIQKKKEENSVAPVGNASGGIGGIMGMEPEDINMPYVYLVQDKAKNASNEDGSKVAGGMFYHGVKKKVYENLEVIVVHAVKGTAKKEDKVTGEVKEGPAWRTLMIPVDNLYQPFTFTFKGMNLWYGWKEYMSMLVSDGVMNCFDKVVKIYSQEEETDKGFTSWVPKFEFVRDTTEEERAVAKNLSERFSPQVAKAVDEELDLDSVGSDIDFSSL